MIRMIHFADLYIFKASVSMQNFNKKPTKSDYSADLFADLIPAGTE